MRCLCALAAAAACISSLAAGGFSSGRPPAPALDPLGRIHIPIGIANTVDHLKSFVEAEGSFSPGFGSYGIYFWVRDARGEGFYAPTMEGAECEHGLAAGGLLIPWSKWRAGDVEVRTEVCEVRQPSPRGDVCVVGARATLRNRGDALKPVWLDVALRPLGPAGGPVERLEAPDRTVLLVDGHSALVGEQAAAAAGVIEEDTIDQYWRQGRTPAGKVAASAAGNCSGMLSYAIELRPGESRRLGFVCPVLPGRRALGHRWDGVSPWAQFDLNAPGSTEGGVLQPDPGVTYYQHCRVDQLFDRATAYWRGLLGRCSLELPDRRWAEGFAAIVGHCAMNLNQGAPDVAVINYNVFNRDGMYIANIFQKAGLFDLASAAIDYFLGHPFNGRVAPEADNPGQILFIMGEHWRFSRDRPWLARVYPAVRKLAAMIGYYRTTPGPHYVCDTSLEFGEALPPHARKELKPGACDGFNPNYTEAYDIAGLRAAVVLADALGKSADALSWQRLADDLFARYDERFGSDLAKGYGSYSVLWPCRLYPRDQGKAWEQFHQVGAQKLTDWRYFPLAKAHQGLLAGQREAGAGTLGLHLDHEQMRGWYAFDEGGPSGVGGWRYVRTTWPITPLPWDRNTFGTPAMPHGWAIAELHLLLRDSLLFEDGDRLVLFAGVPRDWFSHPAGMRWKNLPTHFGCSSLTYTVRGRAASLKLSGTASPPGGHLLRLPPELANAIASAAPGVLRVGGGILLAPGRARLDFNLP